MIVSIRCSSVLPSFLPAVIPTVVGCVAQWKPGSKYGIVKDAKKQRYFFPIQSIRSWAQLSAVGAGSVVSFNPQNRCESERMVQRLPVCTNVEVISHLEVMEEIPRGVFRAGMIVTDDFSQNPSSSPSSFCNYFFDIQTGKCFPCDNLNLSEYESDTIAYMLLPDDSIVIEPRKELSIMWRKRSYFCSTDADWRPLRGKVVSWNHSRYGFVKGDDGQQYLLFSKFVRHCQRGFLGIGATLAFQKVTQKNNLLACVRVEVLEPSPAFKALVGTMFWGTVLFYDLVWQRGDVIHRTSRIAMSFTGEPNVNYYVGQRILVKVDEWDPSVRKLDGPTAKLLQAERAVDPTAESRFVKRVPTMRFHGVVKLWAKGYGFITRDDGTDFFCHTSALKDPSTCVKLQSGVEVIFNADTTERNCISNTHPRCQYLEIVEKTNGTEQSEKESTGPKFLVGTVKFLLEEEQYGFIRCNSTKREYFFHFGDLPDDIQWEALNLGDTVNFEVVRGCTSGKLPKSKIVALVAKREHENDEDEGRNLQPVHEGAIVFLGCDYGLLRDSVSATEYFFHFSQVNENLIQIRLQEGDRVQYVHFVGSSKRNPNTTKRLRVKVVGLVAKAT